MIKSLNWRTPALANDPAWRLRLVAATILRSASVLLTRMARRLAMPGVRSKPDPLAAVLEFYAEAGAPEGALYADGKLVGYVVGVKRL
jgi:hypothetical protein